MSSTMNTSKSLTGFLVDVARLNSIQVGIYTLYSTYIRLQSYTYCIFENIIENVKFCV